VTIGDHVRARRHALGLTQAEAGANIGLCRDALARWELNDVSPDIRLFPRVIAFLGYDPQPPAKSFGEFLRKARRTLGLTGPEFSEKLRVPFNTLHGWERGLSRPTTNRRERVEAHVHALLAPER
jgi:transcriptional regulator with XRE-family HTH domain